MADSHIFFEPGIKEIVVARHHTVIAKKNFKYHTLKKAESDVRSISEKSRKKKMPLYCNFWSKHVGTNNHGGLNHHRYVYGGFMHFSANLY